MKVILHICCGVCAAGAAKTLLEEGHQITGFFCNPNLYPEAEFYRRLDNTAIVAERLGFPLEVDTHQPEQWFKVTEPHKKDSEGGSRCIICYRLRLEKTLIYTESCGFDAFTTTLTVSPHKAAQVVNSTGKEIGGIKFLERDFKKKDGFKKAVQLARHWQLYRQDYCGCIYSMKQL